MKELGIEAKTLLNTKTGEELSIIKREQPLFDMNLGFGRGSGILEQDEIEIERAQKKKAKKN